MIFVRNDIVELILQSYLGYPVQQFVTGLQEILVFVNFLYLFITFYTFHIWVYFIFSIIGNHDSLILVLNTDLRRLCIFASLYSRGVRILQRL